MYAYILCCLYIYIPYIYIYTFLSPASTFLEESLLLPSLHSAVLLGLLLLLHWILRHYEPALYSLYFHILLDVPGKEGITSVITCWWHLRTGDTALRWNAALRKARCCCAAAAAAAARRQKNTAAEKAAALPAAAEGAMPLQLPPAC